MTKEALKLALEALGWTDEWRPQGLKEEAITAIKEALAQDALDRKAENARELGLDYEPVIDKSAAVRIATALGWTPQRTWVGLTDEEIEQGCKESWVTEQAFQSAVWWAEAKLKEKNNG